MKVQVRISMFVFFTSSFKYSILSYAFKKMKTAHFLMYLYSDLG